MAFCPACDFLLVAGKCPQRCAPPSGNDDSASLSVTSVSSAVSDKASGPPVLDPGSAALAGLAGDVVRVLEPHIEADRAGLLACLLVEFGSMVGGMAEARVGFAHHPPAIYAALVGRTANSRKGTAQTQIDGVMRRVEEGWQERHRVGGFGSGEAFLEHAAENPGDPLLMVEPELARLLAVASREGSSVSSVLRSAWDFHRLEYRTRRQKYEAPPAPVSMLAHITAEELKDGRHGLRLNEVMNGFGNRVTWVYVDRRSIMPNPEPVPEAVLSPLVARLRAALDAARAAGVVSRSPEANDLWVDLYLQLATDDPGGIVGSLTARAEAQLLRLSLIYALLDGSCVIEPRHLESAFEFWRYARWSAQHIWVGPGGTGDPDLDRIAAVLEGGDLTMRELDRMFQGNRSTKELRERAVAAGIADALEVHQDGARGRPAVVLQAADETEQTDKGAWWVHPRYLRPGSSVTSVSSAVSARRRADGDPDAP